MEIKDLDLKEYIERCTGQRFDKHNKIHSPFTTKDKTPSFAIYFDDNADKWKFKDFSTGETGDIIDFDMKYNGTDYVQARENVGLPLEKTETELEIDKVTNFIDWSIENQSFRKGDKLLGIFRYCDENNKTLYFKAKFRHSDGSKELAYFFIDEEGKVKNKRGLDYELPYNLYNALKGMQEGKILIFVEGERDVNKLIHELPSKKYVVVSVKNCKEEGMNKLKRNGMKVYVIPDNDEVGEKYFENIQDHFMKSASVFKKINLKNIHSLGKGADITDWLNAGYTKEDLYKCFDRSLDLKNKYELQQDEQGIYYLIKSKKPDEDGDFKYSKEYITNFNILEACKINKIDADMQGIKLKIKSCIDGTITEKTGGSKIFDDIRAFRNFLGMDFSFTGRNTNEVVRLKDWINKYFALDNKIIHCGAKFVPSEKNEFELIAANGTITSGKVEFSKVAEETEIDLTSIEEITKEELAEVMKRLFNLFKLNKSINIIGSAIASLQIGQAIASNTKMHHLFIIGESGSGKSTILENVIAPLLNYPISEKQAMSTTPYAIEKILSTGNYPVIFDEFKPSLMDDRKKTKLKDIFHKSYDRMPTSRGNKNLEVKKIFLNRPLIIAGEEGIMDNEKASVTRSCIVYLSKRDRESNSGSAKDWLIDNEILLKKLGKALIIESLKMSVEEYKELRIELRDKFNDLDDRPQNTAISIASGIELLNKVLIKHGLQLITGYEDYIRINIKEEVLDNGEDVYSIVEQMLIMYENMLQNNSRLTDNDAIQFGKGKDAGKIFIRTQLVIDAIFKYCNDVKEIDSKTLLNCRDFKKQAKKAGYIKEVNAKQLRIGAYNQYKGTNAWFDEYDMSMLSGLKVENIIESDYLQNVANI